MTEELNEQPTEASTISPGQKLRAARESNGLTQQALADKLYLKVAIIQQLEADELSPNTSITFTKGYVRLYAKNVGLEPEALLAEFETYHQAADPSQKLQSFSRRVSKEAHDDRWMMVTYFILAIVAALVVVWWYQQSNRNDIEGADISNVIAESAPVESSQNIAVTQESQTSNDINDSAPGETENRAEVESGLGNLVEPVDVSAEPEAEPTTDTAPVLTDAEIPPMNEETQTDEVTPALGELVELVFTFADDCWVNITDATGEAIAYGVKVAGRTMPVSGIAPFAVTLGAPQHVSITFNGEPVDMSAIPAGQTARFSLPMQEN